MRKPKLMRKRRTAGVKAEKRLSHAAEIVKSMFAADRGYITLYAPKRD